MGKSSSGRSKHGSEVSSRSERRSRDDRQDDDDESRRQSKTSSRTDSTVTPSSRRKSSRHDIDERGSVNGYRERDSASSISRYDHPEGMRAPSDVASYVTAYTHEPSEMNPRERDSSRRESTRDGTPRDERKESRRDSRYTPERSRAVDDDDQDRYKRRRESDRNGGDKPEESRRSSRLPSRQDSNGTSRAIGDHNSQLPQNQFPGSQPTDYTHAYRPSTMGLAAEYYGDHGESVATQPGVRPNPPSIVMSAEQAHLMEPTAVAAPPPEPSSIGLVGAAASFYGTNNVGSIGGATTMPTKPGRNSNQTPNRPISYGNGSSRSPPAGRPPMSQSGGSMGPLAAGAMTGGAIGLAADYFNNHDLNTPSGNNTMHPPLQNGAATPNTVGGGFRPQQSPNTYTTPQQTPQQTPSSHLPAYGAAAAAGLAGAALLSNHASHSDHSQTSHAQYQGQQSTYSMPNGSQTGFAPMRQRRKQRGPFGRVVDWFRDPDGVAEFEQYSEAIGVCKYCFDPNSSPADAPRRHHYHGRRQSSGGKVGSAYGSTTRVDKIYRHSSDEERRRKSSTVKKAAVAGIAAYGAGKIAESIYNDRNDAASAKSSRPANRSRVSFHEGESSTTVRKSRRESERYEKRSSQRRDSSSGSSRKGRNRGSAMSAGTAAAAGAAIGAVALAEHNNRRSSRSRSPSKRSKYYSKRVSPRHSYVDLAATSTGSNVGFGQFFSSPSANDKKGRKAKGFFNFGNASSSSSDADLAFGQGTVRRKASRKFTAEDRRTTKRRDSNSGSTAALLGLAATGVALAAESDRRQSSGKSRRDTDKYTDRYSRPSNATAHKIAMQDTSATSEADQGNEWIDASDDESVGSVDTALAYGGRLSTKNSRESLNSNSGTSKWDWRWNKNRDKKQEREKERERERQRLEFENSRPNASSGLPFQDPMIAGLAGAAAGAAAASIISHGSSPYGSNVAPPLQHVVPIATADPHFFDVRTASVNGVSPAYIPPQAAVVTAGPVPLQQPQPYTPISAAVFTTPLASTPMHDQRSYSATHSTSQAPQQPFVPQQERRQSLHDSAVSSSQVRPSQSEIVVAKDEFKPSLTEAIIPAAVVGAIGLESMASHESKESTTSRKRRDSSPAKLPSRESRGNVSFSLTEEQIEAEQKAKEKEERRRKRREERARRKSVDAANFAAASDLSSSVPTGTVPLSEDKSRESRSSGKSLSREEEIALELEKLYDEERRLRDKRLQMQGDSDRKQQMVAAAGVAAAAAAVGAGIAAASSSSDKNEEIVIEEIKPRRTSDTKSSSDRDSSPAETAQQRIARIAAMRISRTPSPVHEDYKSFFMPEELAGDVDKNNAKSEHKDDAVAHFVEIIPGSKGVKDVFDPFTYRLFGTEIDDDPFAHPWPVPTLALVAATPPLGSRAPSERGAASPRVMPKDGKDKPVMEEITPEIVEIVPKVRPDDNEKDNPSGCEDVSTKVKPPLTRDRSGSKVSWGEHDTYVYEVQTPDYERQDSIEEVMKAMADKSKKGEVMTADELEEVLVLRSKEKAAEISDESNERQKKKIPPVEEMTAQQREHVAMGKDFADLPAADGLVRSASRSPEKPPPLQVHVSRDDHPSITLEEATPATATKPTPTGPRAFYTSPFGETIYDDDFDGAALVEVVPQMPTPEPTGHGFIEDEELPLTPEASRNAGPQGQGPKSPVQEDIPVPSPDYGDSFMPSGPRLSKSERRRMERAASSGEPTPPAITSPPPQGSRYQESVYEEPSSWEPEKKRSSRHRSGSIKDLPEILDDVKRERSAEARPSQTRRSTEPVQEQSYTVPTTSPRRFDDVAVGEARSVPSAAPSSVFDFLVDDQGKPLPQDHDFHMSGALHSPTEAKSRRAIDAVVETSRSRDQSRRESEATVPPRPVRAYTLDEGTLKSSKPDSKTDYTSDPEEWERSRDSKPSRDRKSMSKSDVGMGIAAAATGAAVVGAAMTDDNFYEADRSRRRKSKRSSDGPDDDTKSAVSTTTSDDRGSRRKSKRDSGSYTEDTRSTPGSPLESRKKSAKEDKRSGSSLWGLFTGKGSDISSTSKKSTKSSKSESRGEDRKSEDKERERKRRSRDKGDDGTSSVVSGSSRRSKRDSLPSESEDSTLRKEYGLEKTATESTDNQSDHDPQSFLAERPGMQQSTVAQPIRMDTEGVSGPSKQTLERSMPSRDQSEFDDVSQYLVSEGPSSEIGIPGSIIFSTSRSDSTQTSRSASEQPPLNEGIFSPLDLPPPIAGQTPINQGTPAPKRLSTIRTNESSMSPAANSSPTAIPLSFFRQQSPNQQRGPLSSPVTAPASTPLSPRSRQGRPKSTEFRNSKEYRPLYLLERQGFAKGPAPEEHDIENLPSLPSSRTSSTHPSMENLREYAQRDEAEPSTPSKVTAEMMDQAKRQSWAIWHDDDDDRPIPDPEYLDSRSATPVPGEVQKAREQGDKKDKPKYEFHSPSELLQDPSMYSDFRDEDVVYGASSPLPSVVSTDHDQDFMSARSGSPSPHPEEGDLDVGQSRPASQSRSKSPYDAAAMIGLGLAGGAALGMVAHESFNRSADEDSIGHREPKSISVERDISAPVSASPFDSSKGKSRDSTDHKRGQSATDIPSQPKFPHYEPPRVESVYRASVDDTPSRSREIFTSPLPQSRMPMSEKDLSEHDTAPSSPGIFEEAKESMSTNDTPKTQSPAPGYDRISSKSTDKIALSAAREIMRDLKKRKTSFEDQPAEVGDLVDFEHSRGSMKKEYEDDEDEVSLREARKSHYDNEDENIGPSISQSSHYDDDEKVGPRESRRSYYDDDDADPTEPRRSYYDDDNVSPNAELEQESSSREDEQKSLSRTDTAIPTDLSSPLMDREGLKSYPWTLSNQESVDHPKSQKVAHQPEDAAPERIAGQSFSTERSTSFGEPMEPFVPSAEELNAPTNELGAFEEAFERAVRARRVSDESNRNEALEYFLPKRNNAPDLALTELTPIGERSENATPDRSPSVGAKSESVTSLVGDKSKKSKKEKRKEKSSKKGSRLRDDITEADKDPKRNEIEQNDRFRDISDSLPEPVQEPPQIFPLESDSREKETEIPDQIEPEDTRQPRTKSNKDKKSKKSRTATFDLDDPVVGEESPRTPVETPREEVDEPFESVSSSKKGKKSKKDKKKQTLDWDFEDIVAPTATAAGASGIAAVATERSDTRDGGIVAEPEEIEPAKSADVFDQEERFPTPADGEDKISRQITEDVTGSEKKSKKSKRKKSSGYEDWNDDTPVGEGVETGKTDFPDTRADELVEPSTSKVRDFETASQDIEPTHPSQESSSSRHRDEDTQLLHEPEFDAHRSRYADEPEQFPAQPASDAIPAEESTRDIVPEEELLVSRKKSKKDKKKKPQSTFDWSSLGPESDAPTPAEFTADPQLMPRDAPEPRESSGHSAGNILGAAAAIAAGVGVGAAIASSGRSKDQDRKTEANAALDHPTTEQRAVEDHVHTGARSDEPPVQSTDLGEDHEPQPEPESEPAFTVPGKKSKKDKKKKKSFALDWDEPSSSIPATPAEEVVPEPQPAPMAEQYRDVSGVEEPADSLRDVPAQEESKSTSTGKKSTKDKKKRSTASDWNEPVTPAKEVERPFDGGDVGSSRFQEVRDVQDSAYVTEPAAMTEDNTEPTSASTSGKKSKRDKKKLSRNSGQDEPAAPADELKQETNPYAIDESSFEPTQNIQDDVEQAAPSSANMEDMPQGLPSAISGKKSKKDRKRSSRTYDRDEPATPADEPEAGVMPYSFEEPSSYAREAVPDEDDTTEVPMTGEVSEKPPIPVSSKKSKKDKQKSKSFVDWEEPVTPADQFGQQLKPDTNDEPPSFEEEQLQDDTNTGEVPATREISEDLETPLPSKKSKKDKKKSKTFVDWEEPVIPAEDTKPMSQFDPFDMASTYATDEISANADPTNDPANAKDFTKESSTPTSSKKSKKDKKKSKSFVDWEEPAASADFVASDTVGRAVESEIGTEPAIFATDFRETGEPEEIIIPTSSSKKSKKEKSKKSRTFDWDEPSTPGEPEPTTDVTELADDVEPFAAPVSSGKKSKKDKKSNASEESIMPSGHPVEPISDEMPLGERDAFSIEPDIGMAEPEEGSTPAGKKSKKDKKKKSKAFDWDEPSTPLEIDSPAETSLAEPATEASKEETLSQDPVAEDDWATPSKSSKKSKKKQKGESTLSRSTTFDEDVPDKGEEPAVMARSESPGRKSEEASAFAIPEGDSTADILLESAEDVMPSTDRSLNVADTATEQARGVAVPQTTDTSVEHIPSANKVSAEPVIESTRTGSFWGSLGRVFSGSKKGEATVEEPTSTSVDTSDHKPEDDSVRTESYATLAEVDDIHSFLHQDVEREREEILGQNERSTMKDTPTESRASIIGDGSESTATREVTDDIPAADTPVQEADDFIWTTGKKSKKDKKKSKKSNAREIPDPYADRSQDQTEIKTDESSDPLVQAVGAVSKKDKKKRKSLSWADPEISTHASQDYEVMPMISERSDLGIDQSVAEDKQGQRSTSPTRFDADTEPSSLTETVTDDVELSELTPNRGIEDEFGLASSSKKKGKKDKKKKSSVLPWEEVIDQPSPGFEKDIHEQDVPENLEKLADTSTKDFSSGDTQGPAQVESEQSESAENTTDIPREANVQADEPENADDATSYSLKKSKKDKKKRKSAGIIEENTPVFVDDEVEDRIIPSRKSSEKRRLSSVHEEAADIARQAGFVSEVDSAKDGQRARRPSTDIHALLAGVLAAPTPILESPEEERGLGPAIDGPPTHSGTDDVTHEQTRGETPMESHDDQKETAQEQQTPEIERDTASEAPALEEPPAEDWFAETKSKKSKKKRQSTKIEEAAAMAAAGDAISSGLRHSVFKTTEDESMTTSAVETPREEVPDDFNTSRDLGYANPAEEAESYFVTSSKKAKKDKKKKRQSGFDDSSIPATPDIEGLDEPSRFIESLEPQTLDPARADMQGPIAKDEPTVATPAEDESFYITPPKKSKKDKKKKRLSDWGESAEPALPEVEAEEPQSSARDVAHAAETTSSVKGGIDDTPELLKDKTANVSGQQSIFDGNSVMEIDETEDITSPHPQKSADVMFEDAVEPSRDEQTHEDSTIADPSEPAAEDFFSYGTKKSKKDKKKKRQSTIAADEDAAALPTPEADASIAASEEPVTPEAERMFRPVSYEEPNADPMTESRETEPIEDSSSKKSKKDKKKSKGQSNLNIYDDASFDPSPMTVPADAENGNASGETSAAIVTQSADIPAVELLASAADNPREEAGDEWAPTTKKSKKDKKKSKQTSTFNDFESAPVTPGEASQPALASEMVDEPRSDAVAQAEDSAPHAETTRDLPADDMGWDDLPKKSKKDKKKSKRQSTFNDMESEPITPAEPLKPVSASIDVEPAEKARSDVDEPAPAEMDWASTLTKSKKKDKKQKRASTFEDLENDAPAPLTPVETEPIEEQPVPEIQISRAETLREELSEAAIGETRRGADMPAAREPSPEPDWAVPVKKSKKDKKTRRQSTFDDLTEVTHSVQDIEPISIPEGDSVMRDVSPTDAARAIGESDVFLASPSAASPPVQEMPESNEMAWEPMVKKSKKDKKKKRQSTFDDLVGDSPRELPDEPIVEEVSHQKERSRTAETEVDDSAIPIETPIVPIAARDQEEPSIDSQDWDPTTKKPKKDKKKLKRQSTFDGYEDVSSFSPTIAPVKDEDEAMTDVIRQTSAREVADESQLHPMTSEKEEPEAGSARDVSSLEHYDHDPVSIPGAFEPAEPAQTSRDIHLEPIATFSPGSEAAGEADSTGMHGQVEPIDKDQALASLLAKSSSEEDEKIEKVKRQSTAELLEGNSTALDELISPVEPSRTSITTTTEVQEQPDHSLPEETVSVPGQDSEKPNQDRDAEFGVPDKKSKKDKKKKRQQTLDFSWVPDSTAVEDATEDLTATGSTGRQQGVNDRADRDLSASAGEDLAKSTSARETVRDETHEDPSETSETTTRKRSGSAIAVRIGAAAAAAVAAVGAGVGALFGQNKEDKHEETREREVQSEAAVAESRGKEIEVADVAEQEEKEPQDDYAYTSKKSKKDKKKKPKSNVDDLVEDGRGYEFSTPVEETSQQQLEKDLVDETGPVEKMSSVDDRTDEREIGFSTPQITQDPEEMVSTSSKKKSKKDKKKKSHAWMDEEEGEPGQARDIALFEDDLPATPAQQTSKMDTPADEPPTPMDIDDSTQSSSKKKDKKDKKKKSSYAWEEEEEPRLPADIVSFDDEAPSTPSRRALEMDIPVEDSQGPIETEDSTRSSSKKKDKKDRKKKSSYAWEGEEEPRQAMDVAPFDDEPPAIASYRSIEMEDPEQVESSPTPMEFDEVSAPTATKSKKDKKKKKTSYAWQDDEEPAQSTSRDVAALNTETIDKSMDLDDPSAKEARMHPAEFEEIATTSSKKSKKDKKKKSSFAWQDDQDEVEGGSNDVAPLGTAPYVAEGSREMDDIVPQEPSAPAEFEDVTTPSGKKSKKDKKKKTSYLWQEDEEASPNITRNMTAPEPESIDQSMEMENPITEDTQIPAETEEPQIASSKNSKKDKKKKTSYAWEEEAVEDSSRPRDIVDPELEADIPHRSAEMYIPAPEESQTPADFGEISTPSSKKSKKDKKKKISYQLEEDLVEDPGHRTRETAYVEPEADVPHRSAEIYVPAPEPQPPTEFTEDVPSSKRVKKDKKKKRTSYAWDDDDHQQETTRDVSADDITPSVQHRSAEMYIPPSETSDRQRFEDRYEDRHAEEPYANRDPEMAERGNATFVDSAGHIRDIDMTDETLVHHHGGDLAPPIEAVPIDMEGVQMTTTRDLGLAEEKPLQDDEWGTSSSRKKSKKDKKDKKKRASAFEEESQYFPPRSVPSPPPAVPREIMIEPDLEIRGDRVGMDETTDPHTLSRGEIPHASYALPEPEHASYQSRHVDSDRGSDVSESTRERRKVRARKSSPTMADSNSTWTRSHEEPDDLPRARGGAMTPPPEDHAVMDTALNVAAGLGFGAASTAIVHDHNRQGRVSPPSHSPEGVTRQLPEEDRGWSFANTPTLHPDKTRSAADRDSGVQIDTPVVDNRHFEFTRDSGFIASPVARHSWEHGDDPGFLAAHRTSRPKSPTSSTEDVARSPRRQRQPATRSDLRISQEYDSPETPMRRLPSPVDPASKDRSSALFNSSPAIQVSPNAPRLDTRSLSAASTDLHRSPSIHHGHQRASRDLSPILDETHHGHERRSREHSPSVSPELRHYTRDHSPPTHAYVSRAAMEASPERSTSTPSHPRRMSDTLASNLIDRAAAAPIDRGVFSPPAVFSPPVQLNSPRVFPPGRGSLTSIPEHAIDQQNPRSASSGVGMGMGMGTAAILGVGAGAAAMMAGAALGRSSSRDELSNESNRPKSLGRSKSGTSSLRNLRAAAASQSVSTEHINPDGTVTGTDQVAGRDRGMADVYDGYGQAPESPRSPTRPASVRRRQSMQQIKDLEARLDQLSHENQMLAEAKIAAERNLEEFHVDRGRIDFANNEALQTTHATLRLRDEEIAKLKQELATVAAAHETLQDEHGKRVSLLETQHTQAQAQLGDTSRDLDTLREQHTQLSTGMEDIVRHEIDAALVLKNAEIERLRQELEQAREKIRELEEEVLAASADDVLVVRDEDYFETACQQLCQHVQQWVLRFSKFSDLRMCRSTNEVRDEKVVDRFDNAILDGSDVDIYLADRIRRRDVFMSVVMTMICEHVFTRYLFGMDRDQRQKLKLLEKNLREVGPQSAVHRWRALTLTLLSKRPTFQAQRENDTDAVALEILATLSRFLPPPQNLETQIRQSLTNVMRAAVDLSIEMRTQRAEYIMLPPLLPEYDTNGDLLRKVFFNAGLMNERSGETTSNEELEANQAVVRMVLFPLVVKKGDDLGEGTDQIVVCPAQVLIARPNTKRKKSSSAMRVTSGDGRSLRAPSQQSLGAMSGIVDEESTTNMI